MLKGNMRKISFRDSINVYSLGAYLSAVWKPNNFVWMPKPQQPPGAREETTVRKQSTELLSQPQESACCHPHLRSVRDTIPQIPTPAPLCWVITTSPGSKETKYENELSTQPVGDTAHKALPEERPLSEWHIMAYPK